MPEELKKILPKSGNQGSATFEIMHQVNGGSSSAVPANAAATGLDAAIKKIVDVLGEGPVYISIDIDGLNPTDFPATGVPELGGIPPRDMQMILRALRGKEIVGADFCEFLPALDATGITGMGIANLTFETLCITADSLQKFGKL